MRKVTLAIAMLPLLASAPVLAASGFSQQGNIQLAQAGSPGGDQFSQQVCNLAHQNAQSYARIMQLRDNMLKIQRDNETRFRALEKGNGGGQNHANIGSTAILDDAMRDNGSGGGQGGYQQSPGLQQELIRNLTGKVEDVDAQISFTNELLQKTQDDNDFRFEELEKKQGVTAPAKSDLSQNAQVSAPPGSDLCAQGMGNPVSTADTLGNRAEAMNFQVLELQDQMQKMQEDNERRFQKLEGGRADAGNAPDETSLADATPAGNPDDGVSGNTAQGGDFGSDTQLATNDTSGADSVAIGSGAAPQSGPQRGEPPRSLGSIRFDNNGNVIGETIDVQPRPIEQGAALPVGQAAGQAVASLPTDDNPNSLYQAAYQYVMSGDYKAAETGFREHIKRYPADPTTAEARYWLGESLYGQARYPEAATVFIDTQRDYPDSKRAAENMFKLGMTLEKMDNHDVACATFKQIPERYPKAAPAVLKRVSDERTRIKC
ncbi:tol-pal system protein YbgF [Brucella pseudogrignonensis]|uniref:Cell division coordinator CpoB n=2 Tax=Brucella pseudogrignonensis TaxID=419475 RepID=A0ABU1MD69_9HYPH|nr:tol-pal system protein YbgF [Brucella pseudogrignonensis]